MASALRDLVRQVEARRAPLHHAVDAARALARAERPAQAEALYRQAADQGADGADLLREWADALAALGRADEARELVLKALAVAPDDVRLHHAVHTLGGPDAAYLAQIWPDHLGPVPESADDVLAGLGRQLGEGSAEGHLLVALGDTAGAARAYQETGRADLLAPALRLAGRAAQADAVEGTRGALSGGARLAALRRAIEGGAGSAEVYVALVHVLASEHRYDDALGAVRQGARLFPGAAELQRLWVWLYLRQNRAAEAQEQARRFAQADGSDGFLDHVAALSLPSIYASEDDAVRARLGFEQGLAALEAAVDPADTERWGGLLHTANFELAYQGADDRALQERFGRLLSGVAQAAILQPELSARPVRQRLRVGFVSPFWRGHTVGRLFSGWITHRDRDRIEAYVYVLGAGDVQTSAIRASADVFRSLGSDAGGVEATAHAAAVIAADDLDAVVFPSVGMVPATVALASLRLAPLQAVAWGHPVTTGLDSVDVFLSSDGMEPPGAQAHYSERLVTLPGVGVCVAQPPEPEPVSRAAFGLADSDVVYLCSQSLFKLHPRFDGLWADIAQRVPEAVLVFVEHASSRVTETVRARLAEALARAGADPDRQLAFVPRMSARRFRSLNAAADVYLDTPGWSGGMTTFEALGAGLPPVTWPGPFMRGRHTAAMLRQLGLDELVAETLDDYAALAVRLGRDRAERDRLRAEILARRDRLFGDVSSVRALEAFLIGACAPVSAPSVS